MLHDLLQQIWLTKNESLIYSKLLNLGPTEASRIASETGIARTQTYRVLEDLMEKWLISEVIWNEKKVFIAEDISVLKKYLQKEREMIDAKMQLIEGSEEELSNLVDTEKYKTSVKYFDGVEAVSAIYEQAFEEEFDCFSDLGRVNKHFPGSFVGVGSLDKLKDIRCRNILTNNAVGKWWLEETEWLSNVSTKLLPIDQEVTIDMIIWKNHVSYVSFTNDIVNAVLMQNPDIYRSAKLQFDLLWRSF